MSYAVFLVLFVGLPILILGLWRWRQLDRGWWRAVAVIAVIAVAYTLPWDSAIIAQGVWGYPPGRILGPTLAGVPLEEITFFVLQVILVALVLRAVIGGRPRVR
jgi:lycopene cyclase domain-containing protein